MQTDTNRLSVTVYNPTQDQLTALGKLFSHATVTASEEQEIKPKKRGRPAKTVSDEEDEDFGKKPVDEDELEEDEEEESDEEETSDEEESDEDEDEDLTFDDVKSVLNKYGKNHPDEMKAILLGFNIKSTKELERHPKKWAAVHRKTKAKLSTLKKGKK